MLLVSSEAQVARALVSIVDHYSRIQLCALSRKQTSFHLLGAEAALYLKSMATVTEIGSLISRRPEIGRGRPCIAGTGVSVRRIAVLHHAGEMPEEIARNLGRLSLAQVHAAFAYYYANKAEIDADLEAEEREYDTLAQQYRR